MHRQMFEQIHVTARSRQASNLSWTICQGLPDRCCTLSLQSPEKAVETLRHSVIIRIHIKAEWGWTSSLLTAMDP